MRMRDLRVVWEMNLNSGPKSPQEQVAFWVLEAGDPFLYRHVLDSPVREFNSRYSNANCHSARAGGREKMYFHKGDFLIHFAGGALSDKRGRPYPKFRTWKEQLLAGALSETGWWPCAAKCTASARAAATTAATANNSGGGGISAALRVPRAPAAISGEGEVVIVAAGYTGGNGSCEMSESMRRLAAAQRLACDHSGRGARTHVGHGRNKRTIPRNWGGVAAALRAAKDAARRRGVRRRWLLIAGPNDDPPSWLAAAVTTAERGTTRRELYVPADCGGPWLLRVGEWATTLLRRIFDGWLLREARTRKKHRSRLRDIGPAGTLCLILRRDPATAADAAWPPADLLLPPQSPRRASPAHTSHEHAAELLSAELLESPLLT